MDKTFASAAEAVADIPEGASLAVGGFGLSGVPIVTIRALLARGLTAGADVVTAGAAELFGTEFGAAH